MAISASAAVAAGGAQHAVSLSGLESRGGSSKFVRFYNILRSTKYSTSAPVLVLPCNSLLQRRRCSGVPAAAAAAVVMGGTHIFFFLFDAVGS